MNSKPISTEANERRLIDVEELKRRIIAFATGTHTAYLVIENIVMMMNQADTVDAVEVVRCRDCKSSRPLNRENWVEGQFIDKCVWCDAHRDGVLPDDFCSDGERRGENA